MTEPSSSRSRRWRCSAHRRGPAYRQPRPRPRRRRPPPLVGIDALRADFLARSGGDTVYFGGDSALLGAGGAGEFAAQAQWLRQHPEVVVRIEGHADPATRAIMRSRWARGGRRKCAIIWC